MIKNSWNICDVCGKKISYQDFYNGTATRICKLPDSEYSKETYETLCKEHINENKRNKN